ncbi:MAG TPA: potassium transporter Kup [Gemmatimonadales bacterium]|jgi:KUP system potassium uptake protein|nr:potassium transporter Kup [Gemmatimonadales bacterium]
MSTTPSATSAPPPRGRYLAGLALLALGVVYGDIGTSPLYALREAFHGTHGMPVSPGNVLGVLSLIFWSLILIVSVKYLLFVMRADNKGEGGILALMAMVQRGPPSRGPKPRHVVIAIGIFGAALMYGDSVITPAISVLSAVEGLGVATPALQPWVIPVAIVILGLLFWLQSRGTARVGAMFGPVMVLWFVTLAVLGIVGIVARPGVLAAVSPHYAAQFFLDNGRAGFLVLGAVFLVVTGGEALYADMGHFGVRPIRIVWFALVLPSLLLNYFGQGALLLHDASAAVSPFYRLAPSWGVYPLILLATAAAIIASQAVISGAFSLARQALQLGYWPRMQIEHTSSREMGQIYVRGINISLMIVTVILVLGFGSSSRLAAAYGVAVSGEMVLTTLLLYLLMREGWAWSLPRALAVCGLFLVIDLVFFAANALKIPHGGWVPLAIAVGLYVLMTTWKRGRAILSKRMMEKSVPLKLLLADLAAEPPIRVPGTAVFMYGSPDGTPPALVHNLAHNKVLHEKVVFLTVVTKDVPHVAGSERVTVKRIGKGFHSVTAQYGFMQDPEIHDVLAACKAQQLTIPIEGTTFFLGRETVIASDRPGMARWRAALFSFMSRNALRATAFFKIPPNQVFEVGAQIEL